MTDSSRTPGDAVRIVLVGTTHPGNIGAAARAMKAMGLSSLHLVAPRHFPSAEATARAAGADDLLARATVHETLAAALAGCDIAYGTTARERRIGWPTVRPRAAAAEIVAAAAGTTAIVFGRERSGLTNEELDACQRAIWIPTVSEFGSLNLAQAVQICAYELHLAALVGDVDGAAVPDAAPASGASSAFRRGERPASAGEVDGLTAHLLSAMTVVGYHDPARPKLLERRVRRWLGRSGLLHSEAQFLRGFLSAVEARLGGRRQPPADPS